MPRRQKSVRTIIAEVIMYVGLAAVVGQIMANFWERFMIQSELVGVKTSLHSLKCTVNNIGTAYDDLYKELKNLATRTEKKVFSTSTDQCTPPRNLHNFYNTQGEIEVRPVVPVPPTSLDVGTVFERTVRDFIQGCKLPLAKNASTLTRYPLKSTAVGKDEIIPRSMCYHLRQCYNHDNDDGRSKRVYSNL